ncbi:UNVERIFIED_CONTAM: hypothetical protein FKN15_009382 [Acipenser sinensis]
MFIGTADERSLRPHAFYQVHRITGKMVSTASQELILGGTKILEIPLHPENGMSASIDCAGILKLRNSDIELRKGETDIGRKNTRCELCVEVPGYCNETASRPVQVYFYVSNGKRKRSSTQCFKYLPVMFKEEPPPILMSNLQCSLVADPSNSRVARPCQSLDPGGGQYPADHQPCYQRREKTSNQPDYPHSFLSPAPRHFPFRGELENVAANFLDHLDYEAEPGVNGLLLPHLQKPDSTPNLAWLDSPYQSSSPSSLSPYAQNSPVSSSPQSMLCGPNLGYPSESFEGLPLQMGYAMDQVPPCALHRMNFRINDSFPEYHSEAQEPHLPPYPSYSSPGLACPSEKPSDDLSLPKQTPFNTETHPAHVYQGKDGGDGSQYSVEREEMKSGFEGYGPPFRNVPIQGITLEEVLYHPLGAWISHCELCVEVPGYCNETASRPVQVYFYVSNGKRKRSSTQCFKYLPVMFKEEPPPILMSNLQCSLVADPSNSRVARPCQSLDPGGGQYPADHQPCYQRREKTSNQPDYPHSFLSPAPRHFPFRGELENVAANFLDHLDYEAEPGVNGLLLPHLQKPDSTPNLAWLDSPYQSSSPSSLSPYAQNSPVSSSPQSMLCGPNLGFPSESFEGLPLQMGYAMDQVPPCALHRMNFRINDSFPEYHSEAQEPHLPPYPSYSSPGLACPSEKPSDDLSLPKQTPFNTETHPAHVYQGKDGGDGSQYSVEREEMKSGFEGYGPPFRNVPIQGITLEEGSGLEVSVRGSRVAHPVKALHRYVKSYLLPDKSSHSKRKTSVRKKCINPVFDETLKVSVLFQVSLPAHHTSQSPSAIVATSFKQASVYIGNASL